MTKQLTINFSHCHYTKFGRDKLLVEKSFIILLITNKKLAESMSKVSYGQAEYRISETIRGREVSKIVRVKYMLKPLCGLIFAKNIFNILVRNTTSFTM